VVNDALSRLDKLETPLEDTQESFLGLLECFGVKKTEELHFHPLNFKYLLKMQESDKSIVKILEKDSEKFTLYRISMGEERLYSLNVSQKQNSSTKPAYKKQ
jgi:hypothetical protein